VRRRCSADRLAELADLRVSRQGWSILLNSSLIG
jgi:hypothetical protein